MTGFYDGRKLGQIHEPGPDGRLVIVDAEHFDWVLAGIAGEVLDALQRMNVLEDLNEVLWEQVGPFPEPRRENKEARNKRVPLPLQLAKSRVVYDTVRSSHDG
jgi:hypothetical protein